MAAGENSYNVKQNLKITSDLMNLMPKTMKEFMELAKSKESEIVLGDAVVSLLSRNADAVYNNNNFADCMKLSDILLDLIWEKLNTGYWRDVNIAWRYAYTLVSMMKMFSQVSLLLVGNDEVGFPDVMKTCDMGLLMGAPLLDNILAKMSTCVSSINMTEVCVNSNDKSDQTDNYCQILKCPKLNENSEVTQRDPLLDLDKLKTIKRCSCPSLETFQNLHLNHKQPVIITDAINFWPAMSSRKWSLEYIKLIAGSRTVPIELGSKYTEDSWSQKLMTIGEFIADYIENPKSTSTDVKGYLAQHQLFDQIPELQNDISVPSYCCLGTKEDVAVNAWFGPKGTVSPLHYDDKDNLLTQVIGSKYIRIYKDDDTNNVYPHQHRLLHNTSQVDIENPDHVKFPLFKSTPYLECILKPGEMLYIPVNYWHFVKSLSVSFSISFWWE